MKTVSPIRDKKSKFLFGAPWDQDVRLWVEASKTINRTFIRSVNYVVLTLKTLGIWGQFERLYLLSPDNLTAASYCIKTRIPGTFEINGGGTLDINTRFGLYNTSQATFHTGFVPANANIINPSDWMYLMWNTSSNSYPPSGTSTSFIASVDSSTSEMEFKRDFLSSGAYNITGLRGTGSVTVSNVQITSVSGLSGNDWWSVGCTGGTAKLRVLGTSKNATSTFPVTAFTSPNEVLFMSANNAGSPDFTKSLNQEHIGLVGITSYIQQNTQATMADNVSQYFYGYAGRYAHSYAIPVPPP